MNGTLTVGSSTGVTVTGDGTGTLTITGTVAQVNAALAGTQFHPTANFNGAASIVVTTDDQGNTGTGGGAATTTRSRLRSRPSTIRRR